MVAEQSMGRLLGAVVWKAVMSRGADERTQMNSMTILLASCESLADGEMVDQLRLDLTGYRTATT